MAESDTAGAIPQSALLDEASPNSFAELLARDPFGYSEQDVDNVIRLLRHQRELFEQAEADVKSGKVKSVRLPSVKKADPGVAKTNLSTKDLGL